VRVPRKTTEAAVHAICRLFRPPGSPDYFDSLSGVTSGDSDEPHSAAVVVCAGVLSKTLREARVSVLEDDHVADAAGAGAEVRANLLHIRVPLFGPPTSRPNCALGRRAAPGSTRSSSTSRSSNAKRSPQTTSTRLDALAERLLGFSAHYRQIAQPFDWIFTRSDLDLLLTRIEAHEPQLQLPA